MIVGAQKCGTTALFHYLGQHPEIGMSSRKEVHLFDAPDYSPGWSSQQIDDRYRRYFRHCPVSRPPALTSKGTPTLVRVRGEATPIYMFLPETVPELKRYNPDLKLIVLLRDPVERALSHFYMEKNRGYENLPLWLALRCEPWRLWRCGDPRGHGSAWRRHAYRRRGLYSLQLANLYRHFDARQVLLIRTEDLARNHEAVLQRVFEYLGVRPHRGIERQTVFEGERGGRRHKLVSLLLRLSFLPEFIRMRRFKVARAPE